MANRVFNPQSAIQNPLLSIVSPSAILPRNGLPVRFLSEAIRMDAKLSLGEPRVLISRAAILHNASIVRKAAGPGVKICAMIKADAYGHGAEIVADTLANFSTR